jgi:hypothetical protein
LDVALDRLNDAYAELLDTVESGGLDQLEAAEKVGWWQKFETFRNRLPLIDPSLIADAQANDLPGSYCFSSMSRFLVRMFQQSPVKPPLGCERLLRWAPRTSMLGSGWNRCCPSWRRCNAQAR